MSFDLYDSQGNPIAYTDDGEHIFTFDGRPVAYLHDGSVYSYSGAHIGRFDHGLIRDNSGDVVFFSEGSTGGPAKPHRRSKPFKESKQQKPLKGFRQLSPPRPTDTSNWSSLAGEHFFD